MATLVEKIKSARPKVVDSDFIASWNHPTETQPTDEELG